MSLLKHSKLRRKRSIHHSGSEPRYATFTSYASICIPVTTYGAISSLLVRLADPGEGFREHGGHQVQQARGRGVLLPAVPPAVAGDQGRQGRGRLARYILRAPPARCHRHRRRPRPGFHQASGTIHIRCAILPDEEKIEAMIPRLRAFHEAFMNEFRR